MLPVQHTAGLQMIGKCSMSPEVGHMKELSRPLAQVDTSTRGTQWGTGGMATKLTAARIATAAGCSTVICLAAEPERIMAVMAGKPVGTVFRPHPNPIR